MTVKKARVSRLYTKREHIENAIRSAIFYAERAEENAEYTLRFLRQLAAMTSPILAPAAPKKSRARGKKEKLGGKVVR